MDGTPGRGLALGQDSSDCGGMMTRSRGLPRAAELTVGGDARALESALESGTNANEVDRDGRTGLHYAAIEDRVDCALVLIRRGARVDAVDRRGWTALHFAAQSFAVDLARHLLAAGASVDHADSHGNTPLHRAVFESRGRGEMIALLRGAGASAIRVNRHGVSPRKLAETIANFNVKQWME